MMGTNVGIVVKVTVEIKLADDNAYSDYYKSRIMHMSGCVKSHKKKITTDCSTSHCVYYEYKSSKHHQIFIGKYYFRQYL